MRAFLSAYSLPQVTRSNKMGAEAATSWNREALNSRLWMFMRSLGPTVVHVDPLTPKGHSSLEL